MYKVDPIPYDPPSFWPIFRRTFSYSLFSLWIFACFYMFDQLLGIILLGGTQFKYFLPEFLCLSVAATLCVIIIHRFQLPRTITYVVMVGLGIGSIIVLMSVLPLIYGGISCFGRYAYTVSILSGFFSLGGLASREQKTLLWVERGFLLLVSAGVALYYNYIGAFVCPPFIYPPR